MHCDTLNPIESQEAEMPRPAKTQVALRLPTPLLERIDLHASKLSRQHPGLVFTRVDVVTTLLTQALDAIDDNATRPRRNAP